MQDAAMRLLRLAAAALNHDIMTADATGNWQKAPLNEDLNADHRIAIAEVRLLATRIRDVQVRDLSDGFRRKAADLSNTSNPDEATVALVDVTETHKALNDRIGMLIRHLDDSD